MAFLPALALAQWVQVGFVDSSLTSPAPDKVIVTDEQGLWQRELTLQNRYDVKFDCMVSEPLVLPRHTSAGNFNIHWEQGGLAFSYQFKPLLGQPLQILLEQPDSAPKPELPVASAEPFFTLAPNPFNPTTTISLNLPEASHLQLEVFDILGRRVSLLTDSDLTSGTHHWVVDGSTWASGTYFLSYRLSPGPSGVRRLQLLK